MLRVFAGLSLYLAIHLACLSPVFAQPKGPLVLAASSLQESMTDIADAWSAMGHARPVISFAATSALARQIEAGAPADLFLSADESWMDAIDRKGLIKPGTRQALLSNRLALVAPTRSKAQLRIKTGFPLTSALGRGRLVMADPDTVPAGRYAKAALQTLGVWTEVAPKIARAENVRAALALIERGAAPLGIVYATDAKASKKIRVIGLFPADSHPPIVYFLARLESATHPDAAAFSRFLRSPQAQRIFIRYGFGTK